MRLQKVKIGNIRSIRELEWDLAGPPAGSWNVVLGDNGSGKSTLLRSISLALLGPKESQPARQDWASWLGDQGSDGLVELTIQVSAGDAYSTQGRLSDSQLETFSVRLRKDESRVEVVLGSYSGNSPDRHVWGSGGGWFSCGLGPFRRFEGGDPNANRLFHTNPRLGAHITLFGEEVALTEILPWLKDLYLLHLEKKGFDSLLAQIKQFINQTDFLPFDYKLDEVTSEGVFFVDGSGRRIPVWDLSDGFRSFLSLIFEMIRQISKRNPNDPIFDEGKVISEGVVLIDEMDSHLHPNWQKEIGFTLRRLFPNIQFIVTTHSPLICHAVQESGFILRMPTDGSGDLPQTIDGIDRQRLIYGDILEGLASSGFEAGETRSEKANELLDEIATLSLRQLESTLTETETRRLQELRATFPLVQPPA